MKFKNPWSFSLKLFTILGTVALIAVSVALFIYTRESFGYVGWLAGWISTLMMIPLGIYFMVKDYELIDDRILIHRPFRHEVIRYQIIKRVRPVEDVKKGLVRTFGNSGLFSFAGIYKNKELGNFHGYVNSWDRSVLVETQFAKFVLSPENPEQFIKEVKSRAPSAL